MTKQAIALAVGFLLGLIAAQAFGSTPAHAVTMAAADLQTLPEERRPFTRYAWIVQPDEKQRTALMMAVNQGLSHAATPVTFTATANGRQGVWFLSDSVARLDLAVIGGSRADKLVEVWESLRKVEPYFHANAVIPNPDHKPAPASGADSRTDVEKSPVLLKVIPAPYLPAGEIKALEVGTDSLVPIVRADWLVEKSLSTINGNRYYVFRGFTRDLKLNDYLKERGVNVDNLNAKRKMIQAVVAKRQPTKSPGSIALLPTTDVSPAGGLVGITFDIFAENRGRAEFDPERNLLGHKFDASETIVTLENGQHEYALWNGKGELQDEAPQNAAADPTFLPNDLPRLFPGMSCINCHSAKDGWLPLDDPNAPAGHDGKPIPGMDRIRSLMARRIDVLGDYSKKHPDAPATFDQLAGLYQRDYLVGLDIGRDLYAQSVFLATGGQDVPTMGQYTSDVFRAYVSNEVTPEQAAIELGLPSIDQLPGGGPADVKLLALMTKLPIDRRSFEELYAEIATAAAPLWGAQPAAEEPAEPVQNPEIEAVVP